MRPIRHLSSMTYFEYVRLRKCIIGELNLAVAAESTERDILQNVSRTVEMERGKKKIMRDDLEKRACAYANCDAIQVSCKSIFVYRYFATVSSR